MSSINPFSGYLAQGTQVERTQAADKSRQIRRNQNLAKNVAQRDDELQHQVESSDSIAGIHDDQSPAQGRKKKPGQGPAKGEEEEPRLDVTA